MFTFYTLYDKIFSEINNFENMYKAQCNKNEKKSKKKYIF